ncbi:MAG: membrane protein [Phycisphaerae bacterium]
MTSVHTHLHGSAGGDHDHHGPDRAFLLRSENITLAPGAGKGISTALLGAGVIGIVLAGIGSTMIGPLGKAHALASIHVGVMACLAMVLGNLWYVLLQSLVRAGWSATIRRQQENVATLVPLVGLGVIGVLIADLLLGHPLFTWMNKYQGDYILEGKAAWLNAPFFYLRVIVYILIWTMLARRMARLSLEQDRTGDKWLSAAAGKTSAWGMLVFALSVAFAAFDLLMSTDFRFFSTMWGVYYFAGSAYSGIAVCILVTAMLRRAGKLEGVVTDEHNHDMGKFLFAFTVFWAYIGFSQYFLIWYSNIPEETAYMLARKQGGWQVIFYVMAFGHFLAPFILMLFRPLKKRPVPLIIMSLWAILMHLVDIFWIVRPMVYSGQPGHTTDTIGLGGLWVDVVAIGGVVAVFAALVIRKVASGPLVAVNDPYMNQSLEHKNYV